MVGLVLIVLGVLVVFAIAAAAVGGAVGRLAVEPPKNFFDVDEAVDYVAERLPDEVTARCSYDEVRQVLVWHLRYLKTRGLAAEGTPGLLTEPATAGPVVVGDDEAVGWVIGQAAEAGVELDDSDVVAIIDGEVAYLRAIGALGAAVPEPEEP